MFSSLQLLRCLEHVWKRFHISHFTCHLRYYNWPLLKAVNASTSYIKLCYVYIQFKRSDQSCSSLKNRQSIKVKWGTCDRNGKQIF